MNCFSCLMSRKYTTSFEEDDDTIDTPTSTRESKRRKEFFDNGEKALFKSRSIKSKSKKSNLAQSFAFRELAYATKNFKVENLIGQGGFGKVYKGLLETGQIVAIKQLDENSLQGNQEFIVEVLMLSLLHHPNLVTLVGYCSDGDQRLLVYEYMPMGSLEGHLFDVDLNKEPLDWNTRVKIALGVARGLEYLHCTANPPVIYRDFKSANILLDDNFSPKLSDFGLAKLGPVGENTHVSTRVMGTYGYCAPEYAMTGKLTLKSDIYSFGVVLLELISGRRAIDSRRKQGEQSITAWAQPFFRDRSKFVQLVDPLLKGCFPVRCLNHAITVTAMCLQPEPNFRPIISDIVAALEHLASQPFRAGSHARKLSSPLPPTQWDGVSGESGGRVGYASV